MAEFDPLNPPQLSREDRAVAGCSCGGLHLHAAETIYGKGCTIWSLPREQALAAIEDAEQVVKRHGEMLNARLLAWQETILADQCLTPNPAPRTEPQAATGHLTREALDAAIDQLMNHCVPQPDPVRLYAEVAVARWLDEQPPGTAEKLLRRLYGGTEDDGD